MEDVAISALLGIAVHQLSFLALNTFFLSSKIQHATVETDS